MAVPWLGYVFVGFATNITGINGGFLSNTADILPIPTFVNGMSFNA
jgi:hypothetical protein